MDPLRNLYAQVNQAGGRLQQQLQQPQQIQQQQWPQQQQQQWPQQQQQWSQPQQQWPQQQQQWSQPQQQWPQQQQQQQWQQQAWSQEQQQWTRNAQSQQKWPSPPPRRSHTPPVQWPPSQAFHSNYQQQQRQQYPQLSSYYQAQQSYPQQQQDYYAPEGAVYDDGFRTVPIQQQQQPLVPFKKRLCDAVVPEPSAIVAPTQQGEASSSSSSSQQQQQQLMYNSLTEPVSATLARDVKRVTFNLQQIVIPSRNRGEPARTLRDWDLWGPFFFIIAMSCILSSSASENKSTVFAVVFAVLSAGAVSLTMNVVLLGGKLNFFQSLSVLGYCLFPLDIGAILCLASPSKFYRTIVVLFTFLWSSWSVYPFVSTAVRRSRKALAVYPVFLMYISMGFLVLANG